jgi:hypothetical protein
MNRGRLSVLTIVLLGLLPGLSSCTSAPAVHARKSFRLAGSRLVVDVGSSDLRLVAGTGTGTGTRTGGSVAVQRWLSGTAAKPGHASWSLAGDTLRLSIDCTGLVFHCGSRFQVTVPPRVSVVIHGGDGDVTVSALAGRVVIDGGAGNVQLSRISGPLQVSTSSGSITASAIRSPVVQARSDQGSVEFGFAAAPELVGIASTDGNATARIPVAGHRYDVMVTGGAGASHARVPDDPGSSRTVRVASGSGHATVLPA